MKTRQYSLTKAELHIGNLNHSLDKCDRPIKLLLSMYSHPKSFVNFLLPPLDKGRVGAITFKSPESYYRTGNQANTVKFVEELKQINPTGYDSFTFSRTVKLLNAHQRFYCQLGILRLNRIVIEIP
jgi:hypothetical protein